MDVDLNKAQWYKSRRSGPSRDCVEVAHLDGNMVGVRDSKNPGFTLTFAPQAWDIFLTKARSGDFNR